MTAASAAAPLRGSPYRATSLDQREVNLRSAGEYAEPQECRGAGSGARTHMALGPADFKSAASTDFAIPAGVDVSMASGAPHEYQPSHDLV
jgi:hypothetical protein